MTWLHDAADDKHENNHIIQECHPLAKVRRHDKTK
jgi:hypothetical protein